MTTILKDGDKAIVTDRPELGIVTIVEMYDGTVFVELKNGVEMDFPMSRLDVPPAPKAKEEEGITDKWMKDNIDEVITARLSVHYMRDHKGGKNIRAWKEMNNALKMTYIANFYQGTEYDGNMLYEDIRAGNVSREHLTQHILYKLEQID